MPAEEQRSGGMRSGAHVGLMCPLKRGLGGLRQAGPGICDSKYVEDVKAARSVRVWDRVPIENRGRGD